MKAAIVAWLAVLGFEIVQTVRRQPTMSKAAWTFGRKRWLFGVLLIVGVVALSVHLLQPLWTPREPAGNPDCADTEEGC